MKPEQHAVRVLYIVLLTLAVLFLVSPFFIPIFFAATVALALYPLLLKMEALGMRRKFSAGVLTGLFTIIISIPVTFFITKGTIAVVNYLEKVNNQSQGSGHNVAELVSDMRGEIVSFVMKHSGRYEFLNFLTEKKINGYLNTVTSFLLNFFQDTASRLPNIAIMLVIMVFCTYSFLKHANRIKKFFKNLTGFSDRRMDQLTKIFVNDSRQVYISNIATGAIQSLMVAIGVSLLGLGDFFLVFFITLILSFVPVVGASPIAFIFAAIAFIQDNNTAAIILGALGGVTSLADNLLRPWLNSFGGSKVPPIVAFVSVIGGAILLGFPGLFIAMIVSSIAYDTIGIFWDKLNSK